MDARLRGPHLASDRSRSVPRHRVYSDQRRLSRPKLFRAIRAVESRDAVVLAGRLLQVGGQIFRYAVASGRAIRDPSQDLKGALRSRCAEASAALKAAELGRFHEGAGGLSGRTANGIGVALGHAHDGADQRSTLCEVGKSSKDWTVRMPIWRIPAERMKMRSVAFGAVVAASGRDFEGIEEDRRR